MHSQREGALKTQRIKSSFSRDAKNRLTRHKISDRAGERGWPHAGRTNYAKAMHRSGRGSLHRMVRLPVLRM